MFFRDVNKTVLEFTKKIKLNMNSLFQARNSDKAPTPTGSKQGTPVPKTSNVRPKPKLGQANPQILRTMTSLGSDLAVDDMLLDKAAEEEEKKKMDMVPHDQAKVKIN